MLSEFIKKMKIQKQRHQIKINHFHIKLYSMKQLFTFLLFLLLTLNINAQSLGIFSIDELDNLSPTEIEDQLFFQNRPNNSPTQVNLRTDFQLDSAYFYPLPEDVLNQKRYYSYNNLGSNLGHHTLRLNTITNVWENYRKVEDVRNADDQIITSTSFVADANTLEWVANNKFEYTLDANGNISQSIYSLWNTTTSSFDNKNRWEYTYDSDDVLITRHSYTWDANNDWAHTLLTNFTYDSNGNTTEQLTQIWLINIYNNYARQTYEYDSEQSLTKLTFQDWDPVYLTWINDFRFDYVIVNDVRVAEYVQDWIDPGTGFDWLSTSLVQYSHDANGNENQLLYSIYNFDNEMWEEYQRWTFFHSYLNSSTYTPGNTSLTCYLQNPIHTSEIINCQDLNLNKNYNLILFDLSGKVLLEKNFKGDIQIELPSTLESGMYFMNVLEDGKLVLKEKVVIVD